MSGGPSRSVSGGAKQNSCFAFQERLNEGDRVQTETALPERQIVRQIVEIPGARDSRAQEIPNAVRRRDLCQHRRHSTGCAGGDAEPSRHFQVTPDVGRGGILVRPGGVEPATF